MSIGETEGAGPRAAVVATVRALEAQGLNHGSAGNVSVRDGDGLLVTPTGARGATLTPDALVSLALDGTVRGAGIPSSEWRFHTEVMRADPRVGAVIHTHADACVALSCLRRPLPPFHYEVARFGGTRVPCARYAPFGSDALAAAAVEAIAGHRACLLANHGMIVAGRDLDEAVDLALALETLARQYLLACGAGEPVLLTDDEMAEAHRRYSHYGTAPMPR